ncbi:MAG TPA: response regulator [Candidatus Acidoferrum sp.]
MAKLLVVDDEEPVRRMIRLNLMDAYEIVDTGEPQEALALALEHKPDAILLDLRMPKYSGLELCQTFTSFSATQLIPIFVISGEGGSRTKEFCRNLGVVAYFEKPVDFDALRKSLEAFLKEGRKERRSELRVRLQVRLRLSGRDKDGGPFSIQTITENISRSAFLCFCSVILAPNSTVSVHLTGTEERLVGTARLVRAEWDGTSYPRYAFRFVEKPDHWVLE